MPATPTKWSRITTKLTRIALRCYVLPTLGAVPLEKITPAQIEDLLRWRWAAASAIRASARRLHHGMLHSIYADAERLDLLAEAVTR